MSDVKNSKLLESIFDYARNLGDSASESFTAERFLVAVIDLVLGKTDMVVSEEENSALIEILSRYFPFAGFGFTDVKKHLMDRINKMDSISYSDGVYIHKQLSKARDAAGSRGMSQLTPAILLEVILNDPNDFIKTCLENKGVAGEDMGNAGAGIDSLRDEMGKRLSDILTGQKTEPEPASRSTASEAEKKNPASKNSVAKLTAKVKSIHDRLKESIFGQDNAISVFTTGYFQSELLAMTDKTRTRPRATFLFAGPPGVGKTFLAEKAAEVLGIPFMRFDMSEYSDKEANLEFCGSDRVYKGAKEGNVTSFVAKNPRCLLLFDEIEKSHINVIHLFLQLLDAGRLRDNFTDSEVFFTDAILIFTTNAGKQLYEDSDTGDYSGVTRKVILKALQNDVNAETGNPFFPAAICSRFASGNVVMFNHITANNLREIAKKEVLRHANNFEREIGIRVQIDEPVYTALLFAEGGAADARTIRSRAETFFDDELFELFRLLDSERVKGSMEELESIHVSVALPVGDKEISELFTLSEKPEVLLFASAEICALCSEKSRNAVFIHAQDVDVAKKFLHDRDIGFVLIDLRCGRTSEEDYLNIEDVESKARDFFRSVRELHADIPVYFLQTPETQLNAEEQMSFLRQGVRGVITLQTDDDSFDEEIREVAEKLHQQGAMIKLAKANKLVSFETAQAIHDGGKAAEIKLFDFKMITAIDAEDSKNILSNVSKPDVRFDQVIGAEDAKKELRYFVEYLKNPKKFMGTGVSAPKGVLLYGPPGTGKTMLAKAMASESDVTFITAEGNQFLKKYIGEGSEKVHELFRTARKYAPSILFIDEIDAIAKERRGGENADGVEATLTAFLTEMDGFQKDTTKPVFVLAATNFDVESGREKSLDPALIRRFDRRVYIDLPNREERMRYIRMKFAEKPAFALTEDKLGNIADRSTGMSLADLESVIELSLRTAIRDGNLRVTDDIFEEAFETFNGGEEKKWDASQRERVARHETGHAFLCWQSGETPSYVTIVARGDHGGYMQHEESEGKAIYTKEELLGKIRTSLGGRAAEIVYYGEKDGVSTGASGDLASATNIAQHMICTYGMDEKFGLAIIDPQSAGNGELSAALHDAVNAVLSDEMQKAIALIAANRKAIDALVDRLLAEDHLTGNEIKAIFAQNCGEP